MESHGRASARLLRGFSRVVGALGALGLLLALLADSALFSDAAPFVDALREVGGALVSGAVVAGVVLWFEERREDERVEREERRDDLREQAADAREQMAAEQAWRRDLVVRLIALMFGPLSAQRDVWTRTLLREAKNRSNNVAFAPDPDVSEHLLALADEAGAMVTLLHEAALESWCSNWTSSVRSVVDAAGRGALDLMRWADLGHVESLDWDRFTDAVRSYLAGLYPQPD